MTCHKWIIPKVFVESSRLQPELHLRKWRHWPCFHLKTTRIQNYVYFDEIRRGVVKEKFIILRGFLRSDCFVIKNNNERFSHGKRRPVTSYYCGLHSVHTCEPSFTNLGSFRFIINALLGCYRCENAMLFVLHIDSPFSYRFGSARVNNIVLLGYTDCRHWIHSGRRYSRT